MKKIIRKTFAAIMIFVGLVAGSVIDDPKLSLEWVLILILIFFVGFFGGCYLAFKGEPVPDID